MNSPKYLVCFVLLSSLTLLAAKKYPKEEEKPAWAKKDIRDYSEADLERLLDQWEEDEEPLEPDELPEHLRPQPQIDLNNIKNTDPEELMKLSKKGRTLMTFVKVSGKPTKDETEELTKLWQTSLWNNHIQAERYLIEDDRAIFMYKDGSQAWTAKDYLIEQERCDTVTIDSKVFEGKYRKGSPTRSEL
ncbi:LDLR chaperone boca-like [Planococcus citri]|uniref:LDLR chaperone boca-like n=1 Tax=Planococcus citri TaxID=170843 RepID=UPI0031F833F5